MRGDRGASAVEFALVAPILLAIVLGIVDYGLWFSDGLAVKSATREAARAAAADDLDSRCAGSRTERAVCRARWHIDPDGEREMAGTARVVGPTGTLDEWKPGSAVIVCMMLRVDSLTGFTPMPSDGVVRSNVAMTVEEPDLAESVEPALEDPLPGTDWSWC
jgi:hypothetical protein